MKKEWHLIGHTIILASTVCSKFEYLALIGYFGKVIGYACLLLSDCSITPKQMVRASILLASTILMASYPYSLLIDENEFPIGKVLYLSIDRPVNNRSFSQIPLSNSV